MLPCMCASLYQLSFAALKIIPKLSDLNNSHFILSKFCASTIWSGFIWGFLLLVFPGITYVAAVYCQLNYRMAGLGRLSSTWFHPPESWPKLLHRTAPGFKRKREKLQGFGGLSLGIIQHYFHWFYLSKQVTKPSQT